MMKQSGLQMTQSLSSFLQDAERKRYATQQGTEIHTLLQKVVLDDMSGNQGDSNIVYEIQQHPELKPYFTSVAKTEVPIAGIINGVFISRRIDRLVIDDTTKTITFLDYKTDTDMNVFRDKYKKQLTEYAQLLRSAYPKYKITGFILWTQNWQLEQMISL